MSLSGAMVSSFNPRPREGGDRRGDYSALQRLSFNPRPREGGDVTVVRSLIMIMVSIHAPVKGATTTESTQSPIALFQSTPP